jgi:transcriptional regulator with XRE-family HTH domain
MTRGIYEITTRDPLLRTIFERAREMHVTDEHLADLSGYGISSIYYYRTGQRNAPKLATVRDWAEAVGLELTVTLTEMKDL